MAFIFDLRTHHGTIVAVSSIERTLTHGTASGSPGLLPVIVLTGESLGQRALPFGFEPATGIVVTALDPATKQSIVLRVVQNAGETVSLQSLTTNRFLSAVPGGMLETNRLVISEWERFTLVSRDDTSSPPHPRLSRFVAAAARALDQDKSWRQVIEGMLEEQDVGASVLVDAVWPLLTLLEFDELARSLAGNEALTNKLTTLFGDDFWATKAVPALVHWTTQNRGVPKRQRPVSLLRRWFPGSTRPKPTASPGQVDAPREIGPELDHLAIDGFDGKLASFAHACNASLRLSVPSVRELAIVATARSEGVYLLEWIAYHRAIGVENFFLYSNNNDDGSDELLGALHDNGIIHWTRSSLAAGTSAQNKAYGHALNVLSPVLDYRWALFIDVDEFFVFDPLRYCDLRSFARFHELRQTDAVGVNWVMVGSSGQSQWNEQPLTRRNLHLEPGVNPHIKVMLSPRHFINAHPHFPFAEARRDYSFRLADGSRHDHRLQPVESYHARAFADRPSDDDASIYHYYYKSVEEFLWKSSRNRGDYPMSHGITFQSLDAGAATFFLQQHTTTEYRQNDRIAQCAVGLEQEMERLRNLPGVRLAETEVRFQYIRRIRDVKEQFLKSERLVELGDLGSQLRGLVLAIERS